MSDNKNDECGNVIEAPVGITPKTSRLLSPRSSNVEDAAIQKSVIQQQKKPDLNMNKSENTNTSDNKSKENVADQEEKVFGHSFLALAYTFIDYRRSLMTAFVHETVL